MTLSTAGIPVTREQRADGTWDILVAKDHSIRALQTLKSERLIRSTPPVAKEINPVLSSKEERKLQYARHLSAEIEYTLLAFDEILDARVHLNLPARDSYFAMQLPEESRSSASVLIITKHAQTVSVEKIQQLISGAAGIAVEDITVVRSDAALGLEQSFEQKTPETEESAPMALPMRHLSAGIPYIFSLLFLCIFLLICKKMSKGNRLIAIEKLAKQSSSASVVE